MRRDRARQAANVLFAAGDPLVPALTASLGLPAIGVAAGEAIVSAVRGRVPDG